MVKKLRISEAMQVLTQGTVVDPKIEKTLDAIIENEPFLRNPENGVHSGQTTFSQLTLALKSK
jgi:hypothetical protein